jgi:hypothetical protein
MIGEAGCALNFEIRSFLHFIRNFRAGVSRYLNTGMERIMVNTIVIARTQGVSGLM